MDFYKKILGRVGLLIILILLFGPKTLQAEKFLPQECKNSGLVEFVNDDPARSMAILVQGKVLQDNETYLYTRSDGWTYISSEKDMAGPGEKISNCLPVGLYLLRAEFYKVHLPYIGRLTGPWLDEVKEGLLEITPRHVKYAFQNSRSPSLLERNRLYSSLLIFPLLGIVFIWLLIEFVKILRRGRK